MNLGKLEGEFTWYLRDFLGFTNILSFLLKKKNMRRCKEGEKRSGCALVCSALSPEQHL